MRRKKVCCGQVMFHVSQFVMCDCRGGGDISLQHKVNRLWHVTLQVARLEQSQLRIQLKCCCTTRCCAAEGSASRMIPCPSVLMATVGEASKECSQSLAQDETRRLRKSGILYVLYWERRIRTKSYSSRLNEHGSFAD